MTPLKSARRQFEFYMDAPREDADVDKKVAWLRKTICTFVENDTVMLLFGAPSDPWDDETLKLSVAVVCRLAWAEEIATWAMEQEQKASARRVADLIDHMERRVRTLTIERVPGKRVIEEAQAIVVASGFYVPAELTIQLCSRVAQARTPRRHRG